MLTIRIPYYSGSGHTKRVAEAICEGAQSVVKDSRILDITQLSEEGWQELQVASGVIFGTPTYMGGPAGQFKLFLDETAYRRFWCNQVFVDKLAAAFTTATYPSGDKLATLVQLTVYAGQHGMIWVNNAGLGSLVSGNEEDGNHSGSWLGLMATSIKDKAKLVSDADIKDAIAFGKRFANAVCRWNAES